MLELSSEDLPCQHWPSTYTSLTYTFTVHVRDLLDLQSTLQTGSVWSSARNSKYFNGQRTLVPSTHDEQTLLVRQQILGQRLQCLVHSQDLLDLSGNIVQAINDLLSSSSLEDRVVTQLNGNHDESDVLRSVGLGGGDTDLGTSLYVSSRADDRPFKLTLMWTPLWVSRDKVD